MSYKRILTIQDISCIGQCSMTVALPIMSCCGHETCVLPSAVLSTHTAHGFEGFTFRDLTDDMPAIEAHWNKLGMRFDAIYTGYLGSTRQIDLVRQIMGSCAAEGCVKVVDPAMADNGKLYTSFDMEFVKEMRRLCADADIILPNLTEACLMTGAEYREKYDEAYMLSVIDKVREFCPGTVILTGTSYDDSTTGVLVSEPSGHSYYRHEKMPRGCHGTGDVYASAFVGAMMRGKSRYESAKIAADYVLQCIKNTQLHPDHWYGVMFETALPDLLKTLSA